MQIQKVNFIFQNFGQFKKGTLNVWRKATLTTLHH